jgi:bifunctional polynucleotide phosphatase/kinase
MITWNDDMTSGHVDKNVKLKNQPIACFDFDDTLVEATTRNKKNNNIVKLYHESVKDKLKKYTETHKIVIVSNQAGITKGHLTFEDFKERIENLYKLIEVPFSIFFSITHDQYRKPRIALWTKYINGNIKKSFYCGDAGGLQKRKINGNIIPKDFSDTDYKFAKNIGLKFIHRDEFIFDIKYDDNTFMPNYYDLSSIPKGLYTGLNEILDKYHNSCDNVMIINVGLPGCGKSYVTEKYLNDFVDINQDVLKTSSKCIDMTKNTINAKKNLVIDNTNMTDNERKKYIDLAKNSNYKIMCFQFTTNAELCKHNNCYRNFISNGSIKVVPDIVYNMMKKKYVEPNITEGFDLIQKIDFTLETTDDLYFKYYF